MSRIFCIVMYFTFYSVLSLSAQEMTVSDTLLGKEYFQKINYSNLDSAFYNAQKAAFHLKDSKDWQMITDCYYYMAGIKYWQRDFIESMNYVKTLLLLSKQKLGETDRAYTDGLSILGSNYSALGAYSKAIETCKKVIDLYKQNNAIKEDVLGSYYRNLGSQYRKFGEYNASIDCFENALRLPSSDIVGLYRNLGHSYLKINKFRIAKKNFINGLSLIETSHNQYDAQKKLDCLQGLAEIYLYEQKYDSTQYYLNELYNVRTQFESDFMFDYHRFEIQAQLHAKQNQIEKATQSYTQGIQSTREEYKDFQKHHEIAQMFEKKAAFTHQYKSAQEALPIYQQALIQNAREFDNEDWQTNPAVEQFQNHSYALEALMGKTSVLFDIFEAEKSNLNPLEKALETCQLTSDLIFHLRNDYRAEGSKLFLSDKVIPFYEKAIAIALALYENTGEEAHKATAFQFAEANKALLLLESIQQNQATKSTGIPDSLVDREKELKFQIAFYEKTIAEEKQKISDKISEDLSEMETTLFDLKEAHQGLLDSLKQTYPAFQEQSETLEMATVASIQKGLNRKSGILEIFVGKESIYLFLVHKNGIEITQVTDVEAIQQSVEKLLSIINTAPNSQQFGDNFQVFSQEARLLYQELLASLFTKNKPTQLTVIPDGFLSFLPFEILLSAENQSKDADYGLNNLSYLFKDCLIHYNYSANLIKTTETADSNDENIKFLGFAPSFGSQQIAESRACIQSELYGLRCNQSEVQDIANLWLGKSLLAVNATTESFLAAANQSDILHLATHVCMNADAPKTSKIFFTDGYLTPYDLTNLELNNKLTVLSACNTGSGKLMGGEGVLSLAREFTLAGSPSTLTSLWAIDDCSTSEMMNYYYQNLVNFQAKDVALQQAKITFLQKADKELAHPYYWAAFLQFGEVAPLKNAPFSFWWIAGGIGLTVLLLLLFKFLKARKPVST